jgi:hypothetical protein
MQTKVRFAGVRCFLMVFSVWLLIILHFCGGHK